MSDYKDDEDPNAPTRNQMALKRVETAIRKHADCDLMLALDGICLLTDPVQIREELGALTRRLEEK